MANRKTILAKVMEWHQLTNDLAMTFKVPVEGLSSVVQLALQFASEGQKMGFKQATKQEGSGEETSEAAPAKAKKKYPPKKGYKTKAAATPPRGMPSSATEAILRVMRPDEVVSIDEIIARVIAKDWQPSSLNYRAYASSILSKESLNKASGSIDHIGINQYRLRASYVATLVKTAKVASKPSVKKASPKKAPASKSDPSLNGAAAHA